MAEKATAESWLECLGSPGADRDYRPGHARMRALLAKADLRRPDLRIRVAGTNGKGSTAFMLAHALKAAGLKTGLYNSPHIHVFNERIRIGGTPVEDAELAGRLEDIMPLAKTIGASYFEVATALALHCFSDQCVDVEILEAGVGARLDATTAVAADMALVTPVALDHQDWLGETLEKIAAEKACVMQGCRWAISAPQPQAVARILRENRVDIEFAGEARGLPPMKMAGAHQRRNAALALAAVRRLCGEGVIQADLQAMAHAVANTETPGRLQRIRMGRRRIWLDAAHNIHAVQALLPSLPALAVPFDVIMVFTREDRDLGDALPLLRPFTRRLVSGNGRAGCCDARYACLRDALDAEVAGKEDGAFLVLGSFTSVAAAEDWLTALRESAC